MRKCFFCFFTFILLTIGICKVNASSGYLKSDSIETCNGITYGYHGSDKHWHVAVKGANGKYSASGDPIYTDPCSGTSNSNVETTTTNQSKTIVSTTTTNNNPFALSSDATLKSVTINDDAIEVKDSMTYSTTKDVAKIVVVASNSNAKTNYDSTKFLSLGDNTITIDVIAENGDAKSYNLIITKSSSIIGNKDIVFYINGEQEKFYTNITNEVKLSHDKSSLDLTYKLSDEKANVTIVGNENLQVGDNKVTITVTAQNGDSDVYTLNVYRLSAAEDMFYTILGILLIAGLGYGIYKLIKHFSNASNRKITKN